MSADVIQLANFRESDEDFARNRVAVLLRGHCDIRRIADAQSRAARRVRLGWHRKDAVTHAVEWAFEPAEPDDAA